MEQTKWFGGVCDSLLRTIESWHSGYEHGEVYATRKYLSKLLEQMDIPVQYVHTVPFTLLEMTHLVRILKAVRPMAKYTLDFEKLLSTIKNPVQLRLNMKRIRSLGGNRYTIALVFEKCEIGEIRDALVSVRDGDSAKDAAIDMQIAQQKQAGKGMWER